MLPGLLLSRCRWTAIAKCSGDGVSTSSWLACIRISSISIACDSAWIHKTVLGTTTMRWPIRGSWDSEMPVTLDLPSHLISLKNHPGNSLELVTRPSTRPSLQYVQGLVVFFKVQHYRRQGKHRRSWQTGTHSCNKLSSLSYATLPSLTSIHSHLNQRIAYDTLHTFPLLWITNGHPPRLGP